MGYTHYWKRQNQSKFGFVSNRIYIDDVKKAVSEIKKVLELMPKKSKTAGGYYEEHEIVLRGWDGHGEPEIDTDVISFNGDAENDLDHETFQFDFTDGFTEFNDPIFGLCKTARKPYDQAVCLCLLALANNIEGFEFSSDGDKEDWQPAIDFYLGMKGVQMSDNLKKSLEKILGVTK